jgi:hypothetical protein
MPFCTTDWYVSNRLGVGTDAPEAPIHIRCDSSSSSAFLRILTCAANSGRRVDINAGGGIEYTIPEGTSQSPYIQVQGGVAEFGGGSFKIRTGAAGSGAADRLTVTQGGCVGIGTALPSSLLHIVGPNATGTFFNAQNDGAGGAVFSRINAGSFPFNQYTFNNGNVGVNTTSPSATLHVTRNENQDNIGTIRYENNNTGTGSSTNAQLLGVNKYGCGQYMMWEEKGMRIGLRSVTNSGCGDLHFTAGSDSTQMVIRCSGNVGIGTTTPNIAGFGGRMLTVNSNASFQGYEIGVNGTSQATFIASSDVVYISSRQNVPIVFETGISVSERMRITSAGCIGIGTSSPSYRLHVNGTFYAAGSSQDYKEGICQYNTDSCLFMCLKPKTYQYKDEWKHLGKDLKSETQIGLIAEEVAESHPELAILVNEEDNKVVRNVDYEKLSIILLSEVQKLRQEVDQLKNK